MRVGESPEWSAPHSVDGDCQREERMSLREAEGLRVGKELDG